MRQSYYLWPRPRQRGKPVYYVQFRLEDGSLSTAKSTGATSEAAAHNWVHEYRNNGQVVERENVRLLDFATGFFAWEGDYIRKRRTRKRKKSIGHRHAANMQAHVDHYLKPYWKDTKLTEVNKRRIEAFQDHLLEKPLAPATVNAVVNTLLLILEEAYDRRLIRAVPKVDHIVNDSEFERGILSREEFEKLRAMPWDNPRAKVANMLAALTGMRLGEILGLLRMHIHPEDGFIFVKTTWEKDTGLKQKTKTGKSRLVSVPSSLMGEIKAMMDRSPWKEPTDLVFHSKNRKTPMLFNTPRKALYRALTLIGISEEARTQRCLSFHSWRAFLNTALIRAKVPKAEIQKTTGHVTDAMTDVVYFRMEDYTNVLEVQNHLYGGNTGNGGNGKERNHG